MKHSILFSFAFLTLAAVSCDRVNNDPEVPEATGYYVLNNGSWGNNDSNIAVYDPETKAVTASAFSAANGVGLGDLGQDIMRVGDHIYIAVNGSQTVFVTDSDLKVIKAVTASEGGVTLSPRCLTCGGGKVYVTYYDGYLGEIDPETFAVRVTPVGPNPDGCAYLNGKVYVANSGGYLYPVYNNTASVVDCASFKEVSTITVNDNPALVKACGTKVYVSSFGNYATTAPMIQCIDTVTGSVTDTGYDSPSSMDICGDMLYVLCAGYDENWNVKPGSVFVHDAARNTRVGELITDGTALNDSYSISATNEFIFIGCSNYVNFGDIFVIGVSDGKLYDKFDSQGINPQRVI